MLSTFSLFVSTIFSTAAAYNSFEPCYGTFAACYGTFADCSGTFADCSGTFFGTIIYYSYDSIIIWAFYGFTCDDCNFYYAIIVWTAYAIDYWARGYAIGIAEKLARDYAAGTGQDWMIYYMAGTGEN
jgi:hypothetical protein